MDEPPSPSQNDDPLRRSSSPSPLPEVVTIAAKGDILLDVTFETSRSTLKATRKALPKPRPGQRDPPPPAPVLKPHLRLAYRVDLATLKKHSRYFTNLLGDTRFEEARAITEQLDALRHAGETPGEAEPARLPRVRITDDDQATQSAGRENVFADMLRVLHGQAATTKPVNMLYVVTLAVMADRFACAPPVSRYLTTGLRFKWPATPPTRIRDDGLTGLGLAAEEIVRQKLLVAWLLDQPTRFGVATREMILYGSHRWSDEYLTGEEDEDDLGREAGADVAAARQEAVWWYLPDDLEEELHHRRTLLLRTLASIPSHFLHLYTVRTRGGFRQCKLGYDSSSACDSFQLGEMVKFLASKNLLSLTVPFSAPLSPHHHHHHYYSPSDEPAGSSSSRDFAAVDVNSILAALKQCPNYQVDRHHTNCGLRTRITPVLEYVGSMLSANVIQLDATGWRRDQRRTSWMQTADEDATRPSPGGGGGGGNSSSSKPPAKKKDFVVGGGGGGGGGGGEAQQQQGRRVFRFTRAVSSDQRLRYEGVLAADRLARELFTASGWDWTPEDADGPDRAEEERRHLSMPLRRKLER